MGRVMTALAREGYRCARISASGQRKGKRKDERCIAGDLLAFAPRDSGLPHLAVEVGGERKRLRAVFAELRAFLPAGFAPLLVRYVDLRAQWYVNEDTRCANAAAAIVELRAA